MLQKLFKYPFYQAALSICAVIPVLLVARMIVGADNASGPQLIYWELAFAILLGFIMFNSMLSLRAEDGMIYYRDSIFSFAVLGFVAGGLAYLLSGLTLDEAASFRWLAFVFTFVYLVFLTITSLMRKFLEYAKNQGNKLRNS